MRTILSYTTSESQEELFIILRKSKESVVIKALGKYIPVSVSSNSKQGRIQEFSKGCVCYFTIFASTSGAEIFTLIKNPKFAKDRGGGGMRLVHPPKSAAAKYL